MNIKLATLSLFALVGSTLTAQQNIDHSNCRQGESVEYCLQHKKEAELLLDPAVLAAYVQSEMDLQHKIATGAFDKASTIYVPVVFHLLHNNGAEKISDAQIMDALAILNRDYALQNTDANAVNYAFSPSNPANAGKTNVPTAADIVFRLATIAPNGNCFKGITYTVSSATSSGNGTTQLNAIKNGNDVYHGEWPGNKYLNIFICEDIGGAAGYTYTPGFGGTGMDNGIFVLSDYVGSIGTSSESTSRTLTHECGHWFNLQHVWGPNNNPGTASSCSSDDSVSDTPVCIGSTTCNVLLNSCANDNAYWGFDQIDNAENYMDYSYCSKMFTGGQVTRMRAALQSSTGGRSNVISASNLNAVGANGTVSLCKADFSANKTVVCSGSTITFDDETYNAATGWTWSFPGGTPATSTAENPAIVYNTPGVYQVSLTSTDGSNSDNETKTSYITVLNPSATLPFYEGFEGYTTLVGSSDWSVDNPGNDQKWEITTTAAHTGSKSVKLANFGQASGGKDELIASSVDLSSSVASNLTLSFRYAYRKKTSGDFEYLRVFVSNDCGDIWTAKKTLSGNSLGSSTSASAWTPSASDWVTVHISNFISTNMVPDFRYKFQFQSDNGNNIYLDDINIYNGQPSDEIVTGTTGLDENELIQEVSLYPNPATNELNVKFTVGASQKIDVAITDITGKLIQSQAINAAEGTNLVLLDAASISKGVYFVTITSQGTKKALQFVKN